MDSFTFSLQQIGPAISLASGCCGSAFGCYIAGMASAAAMAKTEEGHGKFIVMASMPSSQSIYGFILMLLLNNSIKAGTVSPIAGIFIGLGAGLSFAFSSIYQGKVAAAGIQASLKQPAVYGKCFAAVGVIESFALFALVFSLLII